MQKIRAKSVKSNEEQVKLVWRKSKEKKKAHTMTF